MRVALDTMNADTKSGCGCEACVADPHRGALSLTTCVWRALASEAQIRVQARRCGCVWTDVRLCASGGCAGCGYVKETNSADAQKNEKKDARDVRRMSSASMCAEQCAIGNRGKDREGYLRSVRIEDQESV